MNDLRSWLLKNNYLSKDSSIKRSHLLFNGGIVYLPEDKELEFLRRYAKEMKKGTKLYYVETRPEIFKFMIDLDIGDDHYWSDEEIIEIVTFVNKIVNEFYDINLVGICCKTPVKIKKEADGSEFIHTGVHVIWPKLYVNSDTAIFIREAILQKMNENYKKITKPWSDILDNLIYDINGYRMVGSDKMKFTKDSNGKKIKVPENRLYWPLCIINGKGELRENYLKRLTSNYEALVLDTSIRYVSPAFKLANPQGMTPTRFPNWLDKETILVKKKKKKISNDFTGTKELSVIDYFIKKNMKEYCHEPNLVKEITRYEDGNLLIKTNSQYCLNIGREHNSCGIYFLATRDGIYQKCLCPCDNLKGRKHGLCQNFTSKRYDFPEDLKQTLFPVLKFRDLKSPDSFGTGFKKKEKEDSKEDSQKSNEESSKKSNVKKKNQRKNPNGRYTTGMLTKEHKLNEAKKEIGKIMSKLMDM